MIAGWIKLCRDAQAEHNDVRASVIIDPTGIKVKVLRLAGWGSTLQYERLIPQIEIEDAQIDVVKKHLENGIRAVLKERTNGNRSTS